MKRIKLTIFFILFVSIPLLSSSGGQDITHKILTVGFTGKTVSFECGVSKQSVDSITDTTEDFENDTLYFSEIDSTTGSRKTPVFHVYWKIYTPDNFKLSIKGEKVGSYTFDEMQGSLSSKDFFNEAQEAVAITKDLSYEGIQTPKAGSIPLELRISDEQLKQTSINNAVEGALIIELTTIT